MQHGFLLERAGVVEICKVQVQFPRVRDRGANADGLEVRFSSSLGLPSLRKAKSVEELCREFTLKASRRETLVRQARLW